MQSPPGAETVIDGQLYLYFGGTSYLGLHGHPQVIAAACEATNKYGLGSATTRAGFGDTPPTLEVERCAAEFFGSEDAFYFASGYVGNHVLLTPRVGSAGTLFVDQFAHYSVADACRFTGLPVHTFPHADADGLSDSLTRNLNAGEAPVVLSDGVFAARGTIAPVTDYCDVLSDYPGAQLCLDDSHALGVLGQRGRGTYEHFGVDGADVNHLDSADGGNAVWPRLFTVGTLSKAFGGYGGIVCGSARFVDDVRAASNYYAGASAPPIPAAAASATALKIVTQTPRMIAQLQENARNLKDQLRALGLETDNSPVPIISLAIGDGANMGRIQQSMAKDGVLVAYMGRYSGLGPDGALRIAVFSTHTQAMIDRLTETLGNYL